MTVAAAAIVGGSTIVGGIISANATDQATQDQIQARQDAIKRADQAREQMLSDLARGEFYGNYGFDDAFGTRIDPNSALFNPVDINQSQLDSIQGNQAALPGAGQLSGATNSIVTDQALERLESLFPGASQNIDQIGTNTSALLRGELPPDVIAETIRNTQGLGGQLGTPGTTGANTRRHLGINSLQAMETGTNMFNNFVQVANQSISPIQNQMTPQQSFLTPSERLQTDVAQAELTQQGNFLAAQLEAAPDPAAASIFNSNLYSQLVAAGLSGSIPNTGIGGQALGASISNAGSLASTAYLNGIRQRQTAQSNPSAFP